MKIWLISDTHNKHNQLSEPDGVDMIIHAGDAGTYRDPRSCMRDMESGLNWLNNRKAEFKVYIPGNHDTALERGLIRRDDYSEVRMLIHECDVIGGLKIFGSPYTPAFYDWAYNCSKEEIRQYWEDIHLDLDFLVTHGPSYNILDRCQDGYRAGCPHLRNKIDEVKPKHHVFGHIHEDGGKQITVGETLFINASVVDLQYNISNNGQIIEL